MSKLNVAEPMDLTDEFACRRRRRRVLLDKCLVDYMNAHALSQRRSACYNCMQGKQNRERFAEEEL